MDWFSQLPEHLKESAYFAAGEYAWVRDEAIQIIDVIAELRLAVCGVDVWLRTEPGPTIPSPFIYTWQTERRPQEDWDKYVERSILQAKQYVADFEWDDQDIECQGLHAYFNLTVETPELESGKSLES